MLDLWISNEAVEDCTAPGQDASKAVTYWQRKLGFNVPRDKAIKYLKATGAWDVDELSELDDTELSQKVLWVACGTLKEDGIWSLDDC